jgi:hypothetical protein
MNLTLLPPSGEVTSPGSSGGAEGILLASKSNRFPSSSSAKPGVATVLHAKLSFRFGVPRLSRAEVSSPGRLVRLLNPGEGLGDMIGVGVAVEELLVLPPG